MTIRYDAARSLDTAPGSSVELGPGEDGAVVWLAAAQAMTWLGKQREKAGTGASGPVAAAYSAQYERWISARRRLLKRRILIAG